MTGATVLLTLLAISWSSLVTRSSVRELNFAATLRTLDAAKAVDDALGSPPRDENELLDRERVSGWVRSSAIEVSPFPPVRRFTRATVLPGDHRGTWLLAKELAPVDSVERVWIRLGDDQWVRRVRERRGRLLRIDAIAVDWNVDDVSVELIVDAVIELRARGGRTIRVNAGRQSVNATRTDAITASPMELAPGS